MLGQHPELYGMPELNLFTANRMQSFWEGNTGLRQIQMHGLLRVVAQLYSGEQTLASIDMAHRWTLRRLSLSTADVYRELCTRIAPLRAVDKSPIYSASLDSLNRIQKAPALAGFPPASC